MKKKVKRKGLSAVITTVLLISLTIVIVGAIFFWMRSTSYKMMAGGTEEKTCFNLDFDIGDLCYFTDTINKQVVNGKVELIPNTAYQLKFNVRSNTENQVIISFLISIADTSGIISPSLVMSQIPLTGIEAKSFSSNNLQAIANFKSIQITPKIKLNNKEVICENRKATIDWENVEEC